MHACMRIFMSELNVWIREQRLFARYLLLLDLWWVWMEVGMEVDMDMEVVLALALGGKIAGRGGFRGFGGLGLGSGSEMCGW